MGRRGGDEVLRPRKEYAVIKIKDGCFKLFLGMAGCWTECQRYPCSDSVR